MVYQIRAMKYHLQGKELGRDEFCLSLLGLSESNRWVVVGYQFPWVKIAKSYKVELHNGLAETGNNPLIDAICSDAEVCYPANVGLLNERSRDINRYIKNFCAKFALVNPLTFQKQCHKVYFEVIKYKKKSRKRISNCKSKVLSFLSTGIYADKICLSCMNRSLMRLMSNLPVFHISQKGRLDI